MYKSRFPKRSVKQTFEIIKRFMLAFRPKSKVKSKSGSPLSELFQDFVGKDFFNQDYHFPFQKTPWHVDEQLIHPLEINLLLAFEGSIQGYGHSLQIDGTGLVFALLSKNVLLYWPSTRQRHVIRQPATSISFDEEGRYLAVMVGSKVIIYRVLHSQSSVVQQLQVQTDPQTDVNGLKMISLTQNKYAIILIKDQNISLIYFQPGNKKTACLVADINERVISVMIGPSFIALITKQSLHFWQKSIIADKFPKASGSLLQELSDFALMLRPIAQQNCIIKYQCEFECSKSGDWADNNIFVLCQLNNISFLRYRPDSVCFQKFKQFRILSRPYHIHCAHGCLGLFQKEKVDYYLIQDLINQSKDQPISLSRYKKIRILIKPSRKPILVPLISKGNTVFYLAKQGLMQFQYKNLKTILIQMLRTELLGSMHLLAHCSLTQTRFMWFERSQDETQMKKQISDLAFSFMGRLDDQFYQFVLIEYHLETGQLQELFARVNDKKYYSLLSKLRIFIDTGKIKRLDPALMSRIITFYEGSKPLLQKMSETIENPDGLLKQCAIQEGWFKSISNMLDNKVIQLRQVQLEVQRKLFGELDQIWITNFLQFAFKLLHSQNSAHVQQLYQFLLQSHIKLYLIHKFLDQASPVYIRVMQVSISKRLQPQFVNFSDSILQIVKNCGREDWLIVWQTRLYLLKCDQQADLLELISKLMQRRRDVILVEQSLKMLNSIVQPSKQVLQLQQNQRINFLLLKINKLTQQKGWSLLRKSEMAHLNFVSFRLHCFFKQYETAVEDIIFQDNNLVKKQLLKWIQMQVELSFINHDEQSLNIFSTLFQKKIRHLVPIDSKRVILLSQRFHKRGSEYILKKLQSQPKIQLQYAQALMDQQNFRNVPEDILLLYFQLMCSQQPTKVVDMLQKMDHSSIPAEKLLHIAKSYRVKDAIANLYMLCNDHISSLQSHLVILQDEWCNFNQGAGRSLSKTFSRISGDKDVRDKDGHLHPATFKNHIKFLLNYIARIQLSNQSQVCYEKLLGWVYSTFLIEKKMRSKITSRYDPESGPDLLLLVFGQIFTKFGLQQPIESVLEKLNSNYQGVELLSLKNAFESMLHQFFYQKQITKTLLKIFLEKIYYFKNKYDNLHHRCYSCYNICAHCFGLMESSNQKCHVLSCSHLLHNQCQIVYRGERYCPLCSKYKFVQTIIKKKHHDQIIPLGQIYQQIVALPKLPVAVDLGASVQRNRKNMFNKHMQKMKLFDRKLQQHENELQKLNLRLQLNLLATLSY